MVSNKALPPSMAKTSGSHLLAYVQSPGPQTAWTDLAVTGSGPGTEASRTHTHPFQFPAVASEGLRSL